MTPSQEQSDRFALDLEESNLANVYSVDEVHDLQVSVAEFYRTLFAVANRNLARRRMNVPEVF